MGFRRSFEWGLAWRTLLLIAALVVLIASFQAPDLRAGRVVAALIALLALTSLWSFVRRTNFLVARFIESVRFEDYAQHFSGPGGGGFDVLGETLDRALKQLQRRHTEASEEARYLGAVIDDLPIALLTIREDGRAELLNKTARQLFRPHPVTRREDLARYGAEFAAAATLPLGSQKITRIVVNGVPERLLISLAHVARLEGKAIVMALVPAQTQLGAVELAAQADLVRVLTHEILNSLTPVTSLAHTAAELVAAAATDPRALEDARMAASTVARRAEGISRFVESYREFAQAPEVRRQQFQVKPWAEELLRLNKADDVLLELDVVPETLRLDADPDLLAQALLNILRNAVRATAGQQSPRVRLSIRAAPQGKVSIEVSDNGPGIPAEKREDIFLPFYTTHKGGSGVGLSFARQVALAHGGLIIAEDAPDGGACLKIIL